MQEIIKLDEKGSYIVIEGLKIVDICVTDGFSGCRCSTSDRNRYDKESSTIICASYSNCLSHALRHTSKDVINDILETLKASI